MGASCGTVVCKSKKYQKYPKANIIKRPIQLDYSQETNFDEQEQRLIKTLEQEEARIGVYFQNDAFQQCLQFNNQKQPKLSKRLEKWFKMITYGLDPDIVNKVIILRNKRLTDQIVFNKHYAFTGLNNFFETYPQLFLSRVSKGPPSQYRWLAWRVITSKYLKPTNGVFEELLQKGTNSSNIQQIEKDLDRTFPEHKFFNKAFYGEVGQQQLMKVLQAYSVYDEKVGYCQSINFLVAFVLLVNGGNEKEAFWFFASLSKTSRVNTGLPRIDGIRGLFKDKFPLLLQYDYQFDFLFQQELPELYQHFQNISMLSNFWLQKWLLSLFLYSFPFGLCLRIWDNILVHGSIYIFQVSIAILKLVQDDVLKLDMGGVNDYFKEFKNESFLNTPNNYESVQRKPTKLPPIDEIIQESLKIKIDSEWLNQLGAKYRETEKTKKQKTKKVVKLTKIKRQALKEMQQEQEQVQETEQKTMLQRILEEDKMVIEDLDIPNYQAEDQQAQSSKIENMGGSSGGHANQDDNQEEAQNHIKISKQEEQKTRQRFLPNIVSYEDAGKESTKLRVQTTRNQPDIMKVSMHNSMKLSKDDLKQQSLVINRNNMVFGQNQYKEYFDKSLSHINSVENISIRSQIVDVITNKQIKDNKQPKQHFSQTQFQEMQDNNQQMQLSHSIDQLDQLEHIQLQDEILDQKSIIRKLKVVKHQRGRGKFNSGQQSSILQRIREQNMEQSNHKLDQSKLNSTEKDQRVLSAQSHQSLVHHSMDQNILSKYRNQGIIVDNVEILRNNEQLKDVEIEEIDNIDEVRDTVGNMIDNQQNGDLTSQNSIYRGESDAFINESNRLSNFPDNINKEAGINSDTIIHFVQNLPI